MKKIILILGIVLHTNFIYAQLNGTYLIGASQPPPFNTITNAVTNLNAVGVSGPVSFLLTDALYEESGIEFITVAGTSTTNTITIRPADGVDAIVRGGGEFVFGIDRTSHLSFNGLSPNSTGSLTITSTETTLVSSVIKYTTPLMTGGNILNISVKNCNINAAQPFFSSDWNQKSYGLNLGSRDVNRDSTTISENVFTGGDCSIYIAQSSSTETVNIINNRFNSSGGIIATYDLGVGANWIIKDNVFTNINLTYFRELGLIQFEGFNTLILTNNIFDGINYNFTSFPDDCILFVFLNVNNVNITNNIIKNINYNAVFELAPGLSLGTQLTLFSFVIKEVKFFHNSVYIPKNEAVSFLSDSAGFYCITLHTGIQKMDFKNNIFTLLQGNKPGETVNSTACIYNFASETVIAALNSNNNIYYVANHTYNYFYHVGSQYNDFSQWQSTHPSLDQNSYWEMPNVVSKDDLHLTQDCNRGTPLAEVPLDFEGTVRSTVSPDIGAYELLNILDFATNGNCQLTLIQFSIINGTNIQSALWNFGDSQTSTQLEPSHTYLNPGTYTVTLTVTYNDNTTKTISKEITVYNQPVQNIILHH